MTKIVELIDEVEGKSIVNTLSFSKLQDLVECADKAVAAIGLTKSESVGAKFDYRPSGPSASSYKYGQGATIVTLIKKASGWFVDSLSRANVYPQSAEMMLVKLLPSQKEIAVAKFSSRLATYVPVVPVPAAA